MAVLTATNLNKAYGPEVIFTGVSLSIPQRARVAIVGPNGIGKTTLLRILAGEEAASSGDVHLARSAKMGYLPQEVSRLGNHTLWEECLNALSDLRAQESHLKEMEKKMAIRPDDADLLEDVNHCRGCFGRKVPSGSTQGRGTRGTC